MVISAEQKEARKKVVGSSNIATLFNLDPYNTVYGLWLYHTGQVADEEEILDPLKLGQDPKYIGTALERPLLDWAEKVLKGHITRDITQANPDGLPMASNLDGIFDTQMEPVEAKTHGIVYRPPTGGEFGVPGADQLPKHVILQCLAHLINCRAEICHVPVCLSGREQDEGGFVMYHVESNKNLMDKICQRVLEYWSYVETMTPPPDSTPLLDEVKRVIRVPKKTISIPNAKITDWVTAKVLLKEAQANADETKAVVLASLGDAEYGESDGNTEDITFYEQSRKEYASKATTFRVLRTKKGK